MGILDIFSQKNRNPTPFNRPAPLRNGMQTRYPNNGPVESYNNVEYAPNSMRTLLGPNHAFSLFQNGPGQSITPLSNVNKMATTFPYTVHNPRAIDPRSTSLGTSVFAPMDKQTKAVVNSASSEYSYTPRFRSLLEAAQPRLAGSIKMNHGDLSGKAAAFYQPGFVGNYENNQAIQYGPGYGMTAPAVTHEGLHAAWFRQPGIPQQFAKVYPATSPAMRDYLASRLQDYHGFKGRASLDNFNQLSPTIQTEIHSYLSEYPYANRDQLPPALEHYYSQFIDPNQARNRLIQKYQVRQNIVDALDGYRKRAAALQFRTLHPGEDY